MKNRKVEEDKDRDEESRLTTQKLNFGIANVSLLVSPREKHAKAAIMSKVKNNEAAIK